MIHETAISRIGDLLRGRLDAARRAEVIGHLEDCADCRALSDTYVAVAGAFDDLPGSDEHADSAELVELAVDPDRLDPAVRARIETHVKRCPSCAHDLEATRNAEAELAAFTESPQGSGAARAGAARNPWARAAVAAAIVGVALAYPAWRGLSVAPRLEQRLQQLESFSGPVGLVVLEPPQRGAEDPVPTLDVAAAQPAVPLAVVPVLDERVGAETPVLFSILDAAGHRVWSREMSRAVAEGYARDAGVVTFLVPSDLLPEGRYTLQVSTGAEQPPQFAAPFRVRRTAPD